MSRRRAKTKNKLRRTSEGYVLDQFSQANLQQWNKFSKLISKFNMTSELKDLGLTIGIPPSSMLIRDPALLKKDLTSSGWRDYPVQYEIPANSQVFGRLLRDAGFEAVIYPSSKGSGKCMAIFAENLEGSDSHVKLVDNAPATVKHVRLDSNNWKELSYFRLPVQK